MSRVNPHAPQELAIFGGTPRFTHPLHVGRPFDVDRKRLHARIDAALDRSWHTNDGPVLNEFAQQLEVELGCRHVIPTANGTLALMVVMKALGIRGSVLVPSFTFIASAHALEWQGISPTFCDIDCSHNVDPVVARAICTDDIAAILGVHLWGRPCDVEKLQSLAYDRQIPLVLDAAHAFGVSHNGRKVGNFGAAEVLSFHATKVLSAGEGGAVCTNDDGLAEEVRSILNFGFEATDNVQRLGLNAKMNELSAAMGLTSLENINRVIDINRSNFENYRRYLHSTPGITLLNYDQVETPNYQYNVLEVDESQFGVSRDGLVAALQAENVLARRYFYPGCHRMKPYDDRNWHLPVTEQLASRTICLPSGSGLDKQKIQEICGLIMRVHVNSSRLQALDTLGQC